MRTLRQRRPLKVLHVVGARPNFMKVWPVLRALERLPRLSQVLVHTGQHYDAAMSLRIFRQLGLRRPDYDLGVGSGSHANQTARIMERLEPVVLREMPGLVLVYGDVNSTVAATLVCAKLRVPVGHVEAGLRSFDRAMPEEINRLLTDQAADLLFTPSPDADENLRREGVPPKRILRVGNVMIDTLKRLLPRALPPKRLRLERRFGLITLHRPSNVDDAEGLRLLFETLSEMSRRLQLVFPVHPRTQARLTTLGCKPRRGDRLVLCPPLGYLEFLALQRRATVVITDSGGVQEETTYLGVPCLTVRDNTERPITLTTGSNTLVGTDPARLKAQFERTLDGPKRRGRRPALWDGRAAERIARVIDRWRASDTRRSSSPGRPSKRRASESRRP